MREFLRDYRVVQIVLCRYETFYFWHIDLGVDVVIYQKNLLGFQQFPRQSNGEPFDSKRIRFQIFPVCLRVKVNVNLLL